jgi:hypothetical protein
MTENEDLELLRKIIAQGGKKSTEGAIDRSRYQRLVDLGWLNAFVTNINEVQYEVTEQGKAAAG